MASTIKVDNVQNQPGTNIINKCGTTITLGASSDTVALAAGASQTGFGRTGTVDWVTTPKTATFTAATGSGYFCNTTAGVITVNLPAGAAGSIISMADYAATWQTNNVTVAANGSEKIGGIAEDATLNTEGQSVTFVYVDSTQGWVNTMDSTSNVRGVLPYIGATGGTPACGTISGDYKIHKFTGPGTFCVSRVAVCAADNLVSFMVVAGGGAGANAKGATNGYGGGGGAGGFRELVSPTAPYTASPLDGYPNAPNRITVTATGYPIAVGSGGADVPNSTGGVGANSVFSSITSAGGGGGHYIGGTASGGSGGGAGACACSQGSGNTPPTTPAQGKDGGSRSPNSAGGGGGATVAGTVGTPGGPAGPGGAGATTCISASPTAYAGGGGGGGNCGETGGGTGGTGGGGAGGTYGGPICGVDGLDNTGGGGGASAANCDSPVNAGAGGSGVVIIRYKFQ